jgi:hypothetical protein
MKTKEELKEELKRNLRNMIGSNPDDYWIEVIYLTFESNLVFQESLSALGNEIQTLKKNMEEFQQALLELKKIK